ncbi:WhiB family transcriptional regulator [Streptomyces sp. NPDC021098]|uniref:WhiB family transcriptional regulator n=1 Tax=unclassified Streptomyces TaxID=2593676 RepID=UPI00378FC725
MGRSIRVAVTPSNSGNAASTPGRDWRTLGACVDEDPELFHPVGKTGSYLVQIRKAKAVCRSCPVVQECLSWALDNREMNGVIGGMDEDERRRLLKRTRRWVAGNPERAWVQILRDRRPEFMALLAEERSVNEIAVELGTNTQTVHNVLRALEAEKAGAAA